MQTGDRLLLQQISQSYNNLVANIVIPTRRIIVESLHNLAPDVFRTVTNWDKGRVLGMIKNVDLLVDVLYGHRENQFYSDLNYIRQRYEYFMSDFIYTSTTINNFIINTGKGVSDEWAKVVIDWSNDYVANVNSIIDEVKNHIGHEGGLNDLIFEATRYFSFCCYTESLQHYFYHLAYNLSGNTLFVPMSYTAFVTVASVYKPADISFESDFYKLRKAEKRFYDKIRKDISADDVLDALKQITVPDTSKTIWEVLQGQGDVGLPSWLNEQDYLTRGTDIGKLKTQLAPLMDESIQSLIDKINQMESEGKDISETAFEEIRGWLAYAQTKPGMVDDVPPLMVRQFQANASNPELSFSLRLFYEAAALKLIITNRILQNRSAVESLTVPVYNTNSFANDLTQAFKPPE